MLVPNRKQTVRTERRSGNIILFGLGEGCRRIHEGGKKAKKGAHRISRACDLDAGTIPHLSESASVGLISAWNREGERPQRAQEVQINQGRYYFSTDMYEFILESGDTAKLGMYRTQPSCRRKANQRWAG